MATRAQRARTAGRARPPVCPATPTRTRRALSLASPRARQAEDFICNWLGNRAWVNALPWAHGADFNRTQPVEWEVDGSAAGTLQRAHNLSFLRVYDAGHMVPRDQPKHALAMVTEFLAGNI